MNKILFMLKPIIAAILLVSLVSPAVAFSANGMGSDNKGNSNKENGTSRRLELEEVTPTLTRSTSCISRESAVKTRMEQLMKLVKTMETTFDKIALKIEVYYTDNVVPSGKVVPSYDKLLLDVSDKKVAVEKAIDKTQADIYSCSSGNPKVLMNQYRVDMQAVKSALANYRTSVKNLIVAVRTVSSDLEKSPTVTPENN
jgi:hypothetical protein